MQDWTQGPNAQQLSAGWDFARQVLGATIPARLDGFDYLTAKGLDRPYVVGSIR